MYKNQILSFAGALGLAVLAILPCTLSAQDSTVFRQVFQVSGNFRGFTTDQLQQLYTVSEDNQVTKYSPDGKPLFRYGNNQLGIIGLVDATNPFQLLVYYPGFRTVVTLDRTLNVTSQFNLMNLDVIEIRALTLSNDNNVWVYDDVAFQLKKINAQGEIITRSADLSQQFPNGLQPNAMNQHDNRIYLNDPENGILVFDQFGQYLQTFPIKGLTKFQAGEERCYFVQKQHWFAFDIHDLLTREGQLPRALGPDEEVRKEKERLYIGGKKSVEVYVWQ